MNNCIHILIFTFSSTNLRYLTYGNIWDLKRLPIMVCARDSKHHNVGQNLFCTSGMLASKNERNGPLAQTSKGVWNRCVFVIGFSICDTLYIDSMEFSPSILCIYISHMSFMISDNTNIASSFNGY